MKLLGSTENKKAKDKNGESVPHLEIIELVLGHCNIVNNDYQQNGRVLYTFFPNKSFGRLLEVLPKDVIPLKTFNSNFSYIEVWFTDQNSQSLEIEDRINVILVTKWYSYYENAFLNWTKKTNISKRLLIFRLLLNALVKT